jgi:hypothetical protein
MGSARHLYTPGHTFYLFNKCLFKFVFRDFSDDLPGPEEHPQSFAPGDADIG